MFKDDAIEIREHARGMIAEHEEKMKKHLAKLGID
jgi:hypothetical protein